ncbi:hypothetical protein EVAR_29040_1 [Eumeta japonica]|uniref:Uncharacterized protein n=1 Tax=Eumeta variegata TaxID=151549 RepID=A0A4C1W426_EUMVA|nr:hypothetical protein EVAR_29040_1 [Eumeta japonica]
MALELIRDERRPRAEVAAGARPLPRTDTMYYGKYCDGRSASLSEDDVPSGLNCDRPYVPQLSSGYVERITPPSYKCAHSHHAAALQNRDINRAGACACGGRRLDKATSAHGNVIYEIVKRRKTSALQMHVSMPEISTALRRARHGDVTYRRNKCECMFVCTSICSRFGVTSARFISLQLLKLICLRKRFGKRHRTHVELVGREGRHTRYTSAYLVFEYSVTACGLARPRGAGALGVRVPSSAFPSSSTSADVTQSTVLFKSRRHALAVGPGALESAVDLSTTELPR